MKPTKVRYDAIREYPIGTVFLESDGPYLITHVDEHERSGRRRYNYTLEKMTPDEIITHRIMDS